MALLKSSAVIQRSLFFNFSASSNQIVLQCPACFPVYYYRRRNYSFQARAEVCPSTDQGFFLERSGRRQVLSVGAMVPFISLSQANTTSLAVEVKKGFQLVLDKKDGYSFLFPFGWQEVVVQGQDKVFKDVIEPLESVSINMIPTNKQDVRELGSPQEVADALIKKVLAPPSQKIKLVEASEGSYRCNYHNFNKASCFSTSLPSMKPSPFLNALNGGGSGLVVIHDCEGCLRCIKSSLHHDADGKAYYTFEFTAQAPNFTRHALGAIVIANGKFYTLTTGANERRWEKMKDRLHTVVDSFKIDKL